MGHVPRYPERRGDLFLYHFHCLQSTSRCTLALPTESPFPLAPMLKVVRARGKTKNVMLLCSATSVVLPTLGRGGKGQRATTPYQASWVVQLFIPPTVVHTLLSIAKIGLIQPEKHPSNRRHPSKPFMYHHVRSCIVCIMKHDRAP